MGLGKTLQTLAVIQKAREQSTDRHPSLIICPTSVVRNWEAEVRKFFSNSIVVIYSGTRRAAKYRLIRDLLHYGRNAADHPAVIVVTSYDVARRDCEELNRIPWSYVVVDEGHNIKNPDAQRTRAIKTINGQHKLALTGTPIQNNLEELWSLFDFVMPNYLGTRTAFRDLYGRNGRVNWDVVRGSSHCLPDRIHPFIMRRLKEDVAKELPSKIVIDQKVELTPLQVQLYKQWLASADCKRMVEEIDAKGIQRSKVLILSVFTKLRAICNHPVLASGQYDRDTLKSSDSGKLDSLQELMKEIVEGEEHRALLFCQSTQMLNIIEHFFAKWQIKLLRLDGQTPPAKRQDLVDQFNGSKEITCFLISTKAGGTGLNLTGADTVIFYDHDWNPANDNQAQDRAYRIGQTRPVTVYKLISKGTIEEKIIERQGIKQNLADTIIGSDEQGFKDLTRDELLSLFKLDEDEEQYQYKPGKEKPVKTRPTPNPGPVSPFSGTPSEPPTVQPARPVPLQKAPPPLNASQVVVTDTEETLIFQKLVKNEEPIGVRLINIKTGIPEQRLREILPVLLRQGKLKKVGDRYGRI